MSNPTREEVVRWLKDNRYVPEGVWSELRAERIAILGAAYLCALDMRDEILDAYEEHPEKAIVHRVMGAVREFNDNSEEDPMLTEGQRRRRR